MEEVNFELSLKLLNKFQIVAGISTPNKQTAVEYIQGYRKKDLGDSEQVSKFVGSSSRS